jgi:hypothetical protein
MKKILFVILLLVAKFTFGQVGIGTNLPKSALEVVSDTTGILIPRIALVATNVATIVSPTISEIVYNTSNTAAGNFQVTAGFYYWNGNMWVRIGAADVKSFNHFLQRPVGLNAADSGKKYLFTLTGNFHLWNGNKWEVMNETLVNVKDYGIIGDGITDDYDSIQS